MDESFLTYLQLFPTQIHRFHLQVKSHAQHEALADLYSEAFKLVDEIIEIYQGHLGDIIKYDQIVTLKNLSSVDLVTYLSEIYEELNAVQQQVYYTDLSNLFDELKAVIAKTKYKITFLK